MATHVLVPGFWLGGWCWSPVTRRLREAGHEVYPVTLTGLGERVHLARPEVDLETHIQDVVNLIEYEDLHDVTLSGHSGGGITATGVADRIPERIARIVYVDSGPLPDGIAQIDTNSQEGRALVERQVAEEGDGWRWPLPSWDDFENVLGTSAEGLDDEAKARLRARAVPEPFGAASQPLRLTNPTREELERVAILCSFTLADVEAMVADGPPWAKEMTGPRWRYVELPTGHWPMFSRPDELADILLGL